MRPIEDNTEGRSAVSTSRSLLARVNDDDPAAWDRLVQLYAPLVLHWCQRQGVAGHDAADVMQEVFQSVANSIGNFRKERPDDTFRGWLRTITRNKTFDHFRKRGKEPQAAGGTDANVHMSQIPEEEVASKDDADDAGAFRDLYHRALELIREHFEERTWKAFWRVVVDGCAPKDVGEELNMSPGTVRVAKSRVLQRLRRELGDLVE